MGGCDGVEAGAPEVASTSFLPGQDEIDRLQKKARGYDSLVSVVFDLTTELNVRSTGEVHPHYLPPPPPPDQDAAAPEPIIPPVAPPTQAQMLMARRAVDAAMAARVTVVRTQDDAASLVEWLGSRGFRTAISPEGSSQQATNTLLFGDSVPLPVVRLVALEMLTRGLPVARMRTFADSTESFVVRLTNVNHAESLTPLTPSLILAFRRPSPRAR